MPPSGQPIPGAGRHDTARILGEVCNPSQPQPQSMVGLLHSSARILVDFDALRSLSQGPFPSSGKPDSSIWTRASAIDCSLRLAVASATELFLVDHEGLRARRALEKSPVRLLQLLANVPIAQNTANKRNRVLPGTLALQVQSALSVGTTAEEVTPADHIIALAIGLAFCIDAFSVCTPKNGRCTNNHRRPAG